MESKKEAFFKALWSGDIPKIKQHIESFKGSLNFTFQEPSKWCHTPLIILTRPNFALGEDGPFLPGVSHEVQVELVQLCLEAGAEPQFGNKTFPLVFCCH